MAFFTTNELIKSSKITVDPDQLKSDCGKCGLYKNSDHPKMKVTGQGTKKILIIGEASSEAEDRMGTQFCGESGELLKNKLRFENIILNKDCWKLNVVRCKISENSIPTHAQIKYCYPYIEKTIKKLKPKLVILMGSIAVTSIYGDIFSNRKITRWRKYCVSDEYFGCNIVSMYDIKYIHKFNKDKNLESVFDRDLKFAISCLDRKYLERKDYESYVTTLLDFKRVKKLLKRIIKRKPRIAYDYESTGLKPFRKGHKIVSIGISVSATKAFAFPYKWKQFWTQKELKKIRQLWQQILADDSIQKIAHNNKFEEVWSTVMFNRRPNCEWDPMMAAHILDNRAASTGLKFQTFINFGVRPYDDHIKPFLKAKNGEFNQIEKIPLKDLLLYNGLDCIFTHMLYEQQYPALVKRRRLFKAYMFFQRGNKQMATIQLNGINMDSKYYQQTEIDLQAKINKRKKYLEEGREARKFKEQFNRPIKITSNQDLGKLFYEVLEKPPIFTAKGQYRTDKSTLESLNLPFVKKLLEMKKYEKAKGTYLGQFAKEIFRNKMYPFYDLHIPVSYRGCIAKGTKILVARNFESHPNRISIEDVKAGDNIYCFDDNLNPQIKPVVKAWKTGHQEIIRIHYYRKGGHGYIDCTPDHRIRLIDGSYKEAQYLQKGDRTLAGSRHGDKLNFTGHAKRKWRNQFCEFIPGNHIITDIEYLNRKEDVYDIEVKDCPNFFANEICVHNSSSKPNFQNIPKRDQEIKEIIRNGIIPGVNCVLSEIDFSGAEVITSCFTEDTLVQCINEKRTRT